MADARFRAHPIFARVYALTARGAEARGAAEHRRKLLAGLEGRALELGAGHGLNFRHYPASVSEVVAVEPEPHLRSLAEQAAARAPVPVRVVAATADKLPFADAEFDAAVASLVLCSVPDQALALGELRRVIRPGGELRFYEHVISDKPMMRAAQRFADATLWPLLAGGCHAARDTASAVAAAGFAIERCERFDFMPGPGLPVKPHIIGVARPAA